MSKNVKSNNKNIKKSAPKAKKSTRNMYKIESLEPRLMMDAEPLDPALEPNLDIDQFDSYVEQIGNLSDSIGGKAGESLEQFDKIDFSQFQLADKANAAVEFVSDSTEQLKTQFADKVNDVLGKALSDLEKKWIAGEVMLNDGKIKLADFVQDYVAKKAEGTGLTFAVEGSKLIINYSLDYAKTITDMGFDLAEGKFELTSEGTNLNTSAKLKAVIDLDKGGNGIVMDEVSDVGDLAVSVEELKVSVDNLGMKAKFMNFVLEEVDEADEEEPDLSISYTSGSEVSQNVNLEFGLVNSEKLPFQFKDGEQLTVATVEGGEWDVKIPEIQMNGEYALDNLFREDVLKNLPFVKESSFTIGEQQLNLPQLIEKINDLWTKVSIALTSAVEPVQYFKDRVQLDLEKLKLKSIFGESSDEFKECDGLLSKFMVKAAENGNKYYSLIDDDDSTDALHLMNLKRTEGGTKLSFVISPTSLLLDSLDIGLTSFENLSADVAFAFDVIVKIEDDCSISFDCVTLDELSLKMGASLPESMWESVPVKLNNAKFIYDVKVKVDGSLESNVSFDSNSVDLVIGESTLYSSSNGSIKCANPGTEDQEWSFKLDKGIIGDLPFVFDGDEVIISKVDDVLAAKIPEINLRDSFKLENVVKVLSSAKIPFVGDDVQEKIKDFSACWNKLVMAIQGAMKQNENTVDISCKNLSSLISQLDKDGVVETTFSELNLKFGEESFNLLASIDEDLIVNLEENADEKNVLTLEFKINRETLSNRPDFGVFIPEDVEMDLAFAIDVKTHVAKSVANIYSVGLNYASVHLNKDDITSEINFGPLSVNIKEGKFDFGVKIDSQMNVTFDDKSKISLEDFELSFGSFKLENLSSDVSYTEENGQPTWSLNLNDDLEEKLKLLPVKIADSALKVTYVDSKWNFIAPKIELNDFEGDLSFESVLNAFESIVRNLNLNFDFKLGSKPVKLSDVAETIKESFFDKYVALKEYIGNFNADTKQRVLNLSGLADMLRENKEEFLSALNFSFEDVNENLLAGDIENPSVCLNPGKNEILLKFTPAFGIFDELDLGFTKLKNVEVSATFAIQITINIDDEGKCSFEVDVPKNALDFSFFVDGVKQFVYTKGDFDWKAFKSVREFFENAATNFSIDSLFDEIVNFPLVGEFLNEKQFEFDGTKFNLTELLGKLRDSRNLIAFVLGDAFAFGEGDVMTLNVDVLKNNQLLNDKIEDFGKLFDSVDLTYGSEKLDLLKLKDAATVSPIALNEGNLHIVFKLNLGEQTLDLSIFKLNQTEFDLSFDCSLEIEKDVENNAKASIKKIGVDKVELGASCDELSLNVGVASAILKNCAFSVSKSFVTEGSSSEVKLGYKSANVTILEESNSIEHPGELSYCNNEWNIPEAITNLVEGFDIGVDFSLETVLSALKGVSSLPIVKDNIPNVSSIVDNLDKTWKSILQNIRSVVEEGKLKLGDLQSEIKNISGIAEVLSELYLGEYNLLSENSLNGEITLSTAEKLTLRLKPNFNFNDSVCIDFLGGSFGLNLGASLEINLELSYEITEGNKFSFKALSLGKATLKVTGGLDEELTAINLGIVGVEFENVSFGIQLEITGNDAVPSPDIELVFEDVDIKIGGVVIQSFNDLKFGYKPGTDSGSGEWIIPEELKRFMSFSSENLVQQVHMYLNTLQTALRNLVESKTKLDFLDGSIDKVVDICDKVEKLIYGYSREKTVGNPDEMITFGLLEYIEGRYDARFKNIEEFVTNFNETWNDLFFEGKKTGNTFCSLSGYVYENTDNSEELLIKKVGESSYSCQTQDGTTHQLVRDSNGNFTVQKGDTTVQEDDSMDFLKNFTFKGNQLVFDLSFNLGKEFELNFAKSLSSFEVASVLTSGYVSIEGGAGIKFTVDVDFASPKINPDENVKDVLTALPSENKTYTVFTLDDSKVNIESKLSIDVVKQGDGSELATVIVEAGSLNRDSVSSNDVAIKVGLTSSNRIYLISEQKFEFASSANAKAFAELKLSGSNLQTYYEAKVEGDEVKLYLAGRVSGDKGGLTIDLSKMDGFSEAEDKIAFLNECFSLQQRADNPLEFVSFDEERSVKSIEPGNSIMNAFGLYVVDVITEGTSVTSIKFGCDARRLQNYDASQKDEQGFKLTNENGSTTTYMRISEELRGNGLEGSNVGVSNKVVLTFVRDNKTYSETLSIESYKVEDQAIKSAEKLNKTLENVDGLDLTPYFRATYTKLQDGNDQFFQVMVSPINEAENVLAEVLKIFDGYLEEEDSEAWKAEYDSKPDEDVISRIQNVLDDVLQEKKDLLHIVAKEGRDHKYKLAIEVVPFTNTVKVIDRVIDVKIRDKDVSVNVGDCMTISNVANAISDAIEGAEIKGVEVTVVGKKIVFTSNESVKISCEALGEAQDSTDDFIVSYGSDKSVSVDFENLNVDENTTLENVINQINDKFRDSGLQICYSEDDAQEDDAQDGDVQNKYLDHLEIVGEKSFRIESFGTSDILRQLGFSDAVAVQGTDGKYRIVGSALSGGDFSNAFKLTEVSVYANMNLSLGTKLDELKTNGASFLDTQKDKVKLEFAEKNVRNYNVGGFLEVGGKHYRITEVKNGCIVVSRTSYEGEELSEGNAKSSNYWKNATYVASASASLGFVGMDVFASGEIGVEACFNLEKSDKSDENIFFGFKIADDSGVKVIPPKTDEPVDGTKEPVVEAEESKDKIAFTLDAYADVFETATKMASGKIAVISENDSLRVSPDFEVTDGYKEIVNQFKNFSVEQLLAVLESLAKNISTIVKDSDVKIPLINKSVGDLVDVAKDLQKVIAEMRQEKVTSVQQFVNFLNKRLMDSIFVPTEDGKNLIDLRYERGELYFDFNIKKEFSVRHRFDFGGSGAGINGEVNLGVSGGFWFSLSAKLQTTGKFDLLLNGDGIKFGADVEIVGDGLSFNLGIGGGNDTFSGDNQKLLQNLIQVGANGENAFVYGKACLSGKFGDAGRSLTTLDNKIEGAPKDAPFEFKIPIAVFGKLPITVLDVSVGDVLLGKWGKNGVAFDTGSVDKCREAVDGALNVLSNHPENKSDYAGLYVLTSKEPPAFKLILDDDDKPGESVNTFVADLSSVKKGILDLANFNLSWFDKIKLGITALNTLFESLEYGINTELGKTITSVPVVGSTLSAGVDFLSVLKDKVLDPFSKFVYESTGLTAEMVADKMNGLLAGYFRNNSALLNEFDWNTDSDSANWERIANAGTWFRSTNNSAEWFFQLGGEYDWGTSLGLDFGFPGLGLEADGGLSLKLNWSLDFGFGISETDGFYFIFNKGNEINVTATAGLNAQIAGSLAGLGLKLDTATSGHKAQIELGFGLNLADGDAFGKQKLKGTELEKLKASNDLGLNGYTENTYDRDITKVKFSNALTSLEFSYAASVDVKAGMLVGIGDDAKLKNSDAPKFPNISGDFEFLWSKTNTASGDGLKTLGFRGLSLDLGSFIDGVLGPIVSKIQKVVEPLEPLIDFLTTPFPVLKDVGIVMTPLDLAKKFSKGKFDDSMIKAIKELISMTKQISAMKKNGLNIALGDFMLVSHDEDYYGSLADANAFLSGSKSNKSLDSSLSKYADKLNNPSEITAQASSALGGQHLNVGDGSWEFIWQHPSDIFKLLMGQDIELVRYDMPKLSFNFDWDTFIRIYGPLGARLGVSFSASINLSFGYDTLGIHQWIKSGRKDYGCLVNGFYVGDCDKEGNDINELSFYGGLTAAAELNAGVKAGVGGGVGINVGFDLYDPNKDGKIRLNEIAGIVKNDGFLGLFDVNGKITAKLYAYVDLWLFSKKWNITDDITLFSFDTKRTPTPVLISKNGEDVVANVGDNAGSRLYTDDTNISLEDGDETLKLELNGNKVTDVTSGRSGESLSVDEGGRLLVNAKKGSDTIILTGNFNRNIEILGGEGDDEIDLSGVTMGEGFYVVIWGGAGNDKIKAAEGLNIIFGDDGVYTPLDNADKEKDKLAKLDKGDKIVVEGKFNPGISGDDIILGNKGNQVIIGGAGADKIRGKEGDNIILGDAGHVEFKVDGNGNIVTDSIETARTDIDLDGGNDILFGGSGADYIVGGAGNDFIDGDAGKDIIKGERGDDYIFGGSDDDTIRGGSGSDIIFGDGLASVKFNVYESFDEKMFNDDFKKAHSDKFSGDKFELNRLPKLEEILAGESVAKILGLSGGISDNNSKFGVDTIYGDEGDDLIFGDAGGTDGKHDHIEGGIGNDVIDGDGGDDDIDGGIDNDVIYGGAGSDIINGGAGNDSIYGDDGIKAYLIKGDSFAIDPIIFGENRGFNEKLNKETKSTSGDAGDDVISSGPGMDFVDGQQGDDSIIVELSGSSDVNYTNVVDTGADNENNVLTIEGTELADDLLMRMNKEGSLGFVARLPDVNTSENIERVNFTKGIKVVNLNANGGEDRITIDGTAATTNVDAGAGNDTIQVGQLYNADMGVANTVTKVKNDDLFNTIKVTTDKGVKFLSDGVSVQSTLNIEGGIGEDTFMSLHNAGEVNMAGGSGSDSFAVYAFSDETGQKAVENGVMSIDGGKGIDSLMVRGSEAADSIVVSKQGLLSTFAAIDVAGVESKTFNAAGGDDIFNVVGSSAEETAILNGGNGNDTVAVGGLDTEQKLRSSDNKGQTVYVSYEILDDSDLDEADKDKYDISHAGTKFNEKYSVLDTSSVPVVVVSSNSKNIDAVNVIAKEGEVSETPAFYVGCSGNLESGSVTVTLRAPMLTTTELQSGDRGILIGVLKNDVVEYSTSVDVIFQVLSGTLFNPVGIYVKALSDNLVEGDLLKSISISSVWKKMDGSSINLTDSVKSVDVDVRDATNSGKKEQNLLTRSDEFKVTEETKTISLGDAAEGMNKDNLFVYYKGMDVEVKWTFDATTRTLNLTNPVKGTLVVNYRSDSMRIDSSKIRLAYDNVQSLKLVKLSIDENNEKIILAKGDLNNKHAANVDTSMYYELNGNTLVFFNSSNHQIATLHGMLTVEFKQWMADEGGSTTVKQPEKICDFLTIKEHSHTLVEKNENKVKILLANLTLPGLFSSTDFTVSYNEEIESGKKVRVKISVEDALRSMNDGVSDEKELELQRLNQDGEIIDRGDSITLEFGEGCADLAYVRLVAKADTVKEEYGVVLEQKSDKKNIDDVEGALYAYGQGQAIKDNFKSPIMLKYKHKYKDNGSGEYKDASDWNESYGVATGAVNPVSDDDSDSVDRFIVNNYDSDDNATSYFKSLNKRDIKDAEAAKIIKDYLVPLYSDAEKAIINDEDALRFTFKKESASDTLLSKLGFAMSGFEFGEFGLGTGKDKVFISKTLHRDDRFQTFTVVNTGDDNAKRNVDDEITVTDYNDNDGQLVINAQSGNDMITAKGTKITRDGMIVLGGAGDDTINVDKGIIALGDMGNIQYKDGDKVVTELGYYEKDVDGHKAGEIIRTETGNVDDQKRNLQTDGIVRGATSIASVQETVGGIDTITAAGKGSVVIGGYAGDTINVTGENNVALGDNGKVAFHNEGTATSWRDSNIEISLEKVETTSNGEGDTDTITIVGAHNVVMGGNGNDTITIGEMGKENGNDNVVLGDGGIAEFTPGVATTDDFMVNAAVKSVKTDDDLIGTRDEITIYGGLNTVMGGAGRDQIIIGEENKSYGKQNVVLGDGGSYEVDKAKGEVTVKTNDLSVSSEKEPDFADTIKIHGGQNTVMGGLASDEIDIYGADNIVLGDGGESIREWNEDNKVYDSIKSVETTDDENGGADTIKIHGGKNAVMGGAKGDTITIGDKDQDNGHENVVLGDGGTYEVNKTTGEVNVHTHDLPEKNDEQPDFADTIEIHGGQNTVMGGLAGDGIDIYGADNIVLGDGGESIREWNSEKKVYEAIKSVKTTDDENGGVDTINIYGGQNAVMGGFDGDNITIGTQNGATSDNNIVLGDGGEYNNEASDSAYIQTQSDGIGGEDHIKVYGGLNVAMGGFADDDIEIHGGENVVLGDGGVANYDKKPDAATVNEFINSGLRYVETTSDDVGGHDDIDIFGDTNVVMGGADGDIIDIAGNDNVVVGDGGRYDIYDTYRTVQTKSEQDGGHDVIHTNDGKNIVMGGMDSDEITTGAGNDIILGDGGFAKVDRDFNAIYVTNEGRNIETLDKDEQVVVREDGTAGADTIIAGNGDNVVFGGLDSDDITTGNGQDVVFGDNAYATFRGNANEAFEQVGDRQNVPDVYEEATLSFNFQGASQTGLNAGDFVGAYNEENGDDYRSSNWNNISGSLAGTYGNDDREVVNMDNLDATGEKSADETRVRASGVSVSYGGIESHRNTSTDNRINLQAYNLGLWNAQYDKNAKLMNSGLMTTAPNAQCENKLDVQMDGLAQYFTSYRVVVYLDIPDSHSAANNSVRKVSLYTNDSEDPIKTFYVKDNAGHNFHGSYERSTAETAASAMVANYVVFTVDEGVAADRIRVVIEEADPNAQNGKNLPGIAAIQVRGTLHKQDVAATTDIDFGGNDTIRTDLGDDIVVGGTGSDDITTFGDERYGIHDNDVVFGDNAKILLTDRDSDESTASTISTAESVAVTNIDTATYDDTINTGDGNDTVVGGIGADTIHAGATEAAEAMLDGVKAASVNFTLENADASLKVGHGETAGVVADTAWCNMYVKNGELHDVDNYSSHSVKGINVTISSYQQNSGWWNEMYAGNYAMTHENSSELDGDTANSKLFNGYLASQQNDEIKLTLDSIDQFRAQSGLAAGDACDIYVYLGADNGDSDTYNYIYQVSLNNGEKRFLNDWTGYNFDGDYREATCDSYEDAMSALHEGSAVRMEIVGNYVVFRNFTGNRAEIRIKNVYTSSGQNPKNLPVISAVQVVAGAGKDAAAIGGDHDKDLVYGDDAKLVFDLDVPFDADVPNVSEYKNRVIEAKSVAIEHDAVTSISTNDTITTGKDRDVVVGGEGADDITMGAGDDIALGGSANLVLEHNNPLGVFTPNTEIVLDQHTIDTTVHQNYLDNDIAKVWQFQSKLDQNQIQGIDTSVSNENDREDTIDVGEGRNLTSQGSDSTAQLVVPKPVIVEEDGQEGSGEASTPTPPVSGQDSVRQFVLGQREVMSYVEISAGQTVEIVLTDWNEGNQYYHPNIVLQMSATDDVRHNLSVTWDGLEEPKQVSLLSYGIVDIPDSANVVGEHKIVLRMTCDDDIVFMASAGQR